MVRIRIPGGQTSSAALTALSDIAQRHGGGDLQLTSRANIQIRGVTPNRLGALVDAVGGTGLLPSASHERVRNIVASPLTGLVSGQADVRPLIAELDGRLCADPELARLPGRFLFALDDGSGDVGSLAFDLGARVEPDGTALVLLAGGSRGFRATLGGAVGSMLQLARRFVAVRESFARPPWHVGEVDLALLAPDAVPVPGAAGGPPPLGRVGGAASVQVPLGLLTPAQVAAVAAVGDGAVVLTPWRGLVVAGGGGGLAALAAAGLVTAEWSAWSTLTACIGAPGCGRAAISTRDLATALAGVLSSEGPTVHVSGCERRCGSPGDPHLALVAPPSVQRALELVAAGGGPG
jgi:precorrin-3B synthase